MFGPPNIQKLKSKKNVKGLIKALKYKKPPIRKEAVRALGEMRAERAVNPLIQAFNQNPLLRYDILMALGTIGNAEVIEYLIQILKTKDTHLLIHTKAAASALAEIGKPAVEPLINALKDQRWRVRSDAATALGNIGDERAVEPLIQVLKTETLAVATALGKIGNERAVEPFIQILRMDAAKSRFKVEAATALGEIGNIKAIEPLIQALEDKNLNWRKEIPQVDKALSKIQSEKAVEPLIQALEKDTNTARQKLSIIKVLGDIGDNQAVNPLIKKLNDQSKEVRSVTAIALGKIGDGKAVKPLIHVLRKDVSSWTQDSAAGALMMIGDVTTTEPLINWLFQYASTPVFNYEGAVSGVRARYWPEKTMFGKYSRLINDIADDCRRMSLFYQNARERKLRSDNALFELCGIKTPISTNILHKVLKKKDFKIRVREGRMGAPDTYDTFSYQDQRTRAKKELELRGNPPYDPAAYLDEKAWKL